MVGVRDVCAQRWRQLAWGGRSEGHVRAALEAVGMGRRSEGHVCAARKAAT